MYGWLLVPPLLSLAACEGERFDEFREDTGVSGQDATVLEPLPLAPGDRFTFVGRMTARDGSATGDLSASYTFEVTIDGVDDQGLTADSMLSFSVAGHNSVNRGWSDVYDYSSWVGRLGPSLPSDQISTGSVKVGLGALPEIPARANPKQLPAGNFFLDRRRILEVRDRFADVHRNDRPRVVDAATNNGRWRFEYTAVDPTIITYDVQTRTVVLEVDSRGVVVRLEERLGEADQPPFAMTSLEFVP